MWSENASSVPDFSTRDVEAVLAEFDLKSLSPLRSAEPPSCSTRNSMPRATGHSARSRLSLDARYDKQRDGGVLRDAALLSAIGIDPDGNAPCPGVSLAPSEVELHEEVVLRRRGGSYLGGAAGGRVEFRAPSLSRPPAMGEVRCGELAAARRKGDRDQGQGRAAVDAGPGCEPPGANAECAALHCGFSNVVSTVELPISGDVGKTLR